MKVVTAEEMRRIEQLSIQAGMREEAFMQAAGDAVAQRVLSYPPGEVLLLVGKGNNGGDAFAAGMTLLKAGWKVGASLLAPLSECSPLCKKMGERFFAMGGREKKGGDLILDGLTGSGFTGVAEGPLRSQIEWANQLRLPILSIDLPSGLSGTTGEGEAIIRATETVTLGLPKIGLFIGKGWEHAGKVAVAPFGLPERFVEEAVPVAMIPEEKERALAPIARGRHKYQAGYVLGYGGSPGMMGAMKLAASAVLRSGAGIVRIFSQHEIGETPLSVISEKWSQAGWEKELKRAQSVFIGPGMGRAPSVKRWLKQRLPSLVPPCVLDGDALFFLPDLPKWPKRAILTPHKGELARLGGDAQAIADERGAVVVVKGAPTFVRVPRQIPYVIPHGDPGMATAGTGDVLTGMIAAFLAQGQAPLNAALVGVHLHAIAGERAARDLTSYCVTAPDLLNYLPEAFRACTSR